MNEYLKNRSKNKIDFKVDRGLSTKLPSINQKSAKLANPSAEYEHANLVDELDNINNKLSDKFEDSAFLDEIFKRAFVLTSKPLLDRKLFYENIAGNKSANVNIDLYHSGTNNACIAFGHSLKRNESARDIKPPMIVHEYIGNAGALKYDEQEDADFIKHFQMMLDCAFRCFGKRYNQLSKEELKWPQDADFTIVEKQQFAALKYDADNILVADVIITKFIQYSLKIFDPSVLDKKIKELCMTFPSDFDTAQRTTLRECLTRLSIKKCNLITKPLAIAAPLLIESPNDDKKNLVIDFGSGYLSCSIMTTKSGKHINVKDRIIKKKIATEGIMKNLIGTVTSELQKSGSKSSDTLYIRNQLEKSLNEYSQLLENPETRNNVPSTIDVELDDRTIKIDVNKFGGDKLAKEIESALKDMPLDLQTDNSIYRVCNESFRLILNINPIVAKFLIPKLTVMYPNAEIVLKSSEYFIPYGATTLAQQMKFGIETHDLLPYSVGISLYNGVIMKIVDGKSNYPCNGNHVFNTVSDNQKTIRVMAYEGDRKLARNCNPIGEYVVNNLPQVQAGQLQCQITFKFDQNGILTALAYDTTHNKELNIQLNSTPHLGNFKKSPDGLVLNESADTEGDKNLYTALDQLDLFMDYLAELAKDAANEQSLEILLKVRRAKNYINSHKHEITTDNCQQLRLELEECADKNNLERDKNFAAPVKEETQPKTSTNPKVEPIKNNTNDAKVESKTCILM